MEVPDGHLVLGSPARVVKPLDEHTQTKFIASAEHYVANGQRYLKELKEVVA